MLGSTAARRLLASRSRLVALPAFIRHSTLPPQPLHPQNPSEQQQPPPPLETPIPPPPSSTSTARAKSEHEAHRSSSATGRRLGGDYEEVQAQVLRAALPYVVKLGWGEPALISGAKVVGVSPSIVGSFPRKEATLVEFFMDDCLQRLVDRIDSGEELQNLILSDRLSKLIRLRLEMQAPYISKWPQALSIQAQPVNLQTSFKQRALLIDEIWHAAGDQGSDIDWYVKRTVLAGIYSATEVYMLTDHSPAFCDTWNFLERRIKDAFDLQKSIQEAGYLAEAVGAGMGSSMQGFMRKIFQG